MPESDAKRSRRKKLRKSYATAAHNGNPSHEVVKLKSPSNHHAYKAWQSRDTKRKQLGPWQTARSKGAKRRGDNTRSHGINVGDRGLAGARDLRRTLGSVFQNIRAPTDTLSQELPARGALPRSRGAGVAARGRGSLMSSRIGLSHTVKQAPPTGAPRRESRTTPRRGGNQARERTSTPNHIDSSYWGRYERKPVMASNNLFDLLAS